ncbi:MAG: DUF4388 domain-containing protein [Ktedonobacteraceae bacterium]
MYQRGTSTNRLADVIQVVQVTHKTGLLTIERGEIDSTLEEGEITFVNGQITDAHSGQHSGIAAVNWLRTWGACRFTFLPLTSDDPPPSTSPLPRLTPDMLAPSNGHFPPPTPVNIVPRRTREVAEVLPAFEFLGLTRSHRRIFLLIDGQRTVTELIHLMGGRADEVYAWLADLEGADLIQQEQI